MECASEQGGELLTLSAADVKCILKVYFCWRELPIDDVVITSERVRMLLQLLTVLLRSVSHIFRRLRASSLCVFPVLHSPPVPPTGLSPTSLWQYIVSIAWSRWAHTLKLPTQTATCSAFVEMPLSPPVPIHRLMYIDCLVSELADWHCGTAV